MFYSNGLFQIQTVGKALHFSSTTVFSLFKNNVIISAEKLHLIQKFQSTLIHFFLLYFNALHFSKKQNFPVYLLNSEAASCAPGSMMYDAVRYWKNVDWQCLDLRVMCINYMLQL